MLGNGDLPPLVFSHIYNYFLRVRSVKDMIFYKQVLNLIDTHYYWPLNFRAACPSGLQELRPDRQQLFE